jgi:hypothetical protein
LKALPDRIIRIHALNPSAQMEQIDQLNTLLLQEIDENFAKFHQIVTSHVLPEVKRCLTDAALSKNERQNWKRIHISLASTGWAELTVAASRVGSLANASSSGVRFSKERRLSS